MFFIINAPDNPRFPAGVYFLLTKAVSGCRINVREGISMKLTIDDKLKIYKLKKRGYRYKDIGKQFCTDPSNLSYMCDLIDLYGKKGS